MPRHLRIKMSQHAPSPVRYVTESQVQSLLSVEASICVNDAVFRAHAAGMFLF